jgi:Iron/zinc purple acid phosphatase-like protein C
MPTIGDSTLFFLSIYLLLLISRTCDRVFQGECNSPRGPIHITIGSAGAPLDDFYKNTTYDQKWTARYLRGLFGYGKVNVVNDTALRFEFLSFNDNEVLDEVWILRDRPHIHH